MPETTAKWPSSQRYDETAFYCLPLRLSIFLFAGATFLSSLSYCLNTSGWDSAFRYFEGGYALASRVVLGWIQASGLLGGLLGVTGAWYVKVSHVQGFYYWQIMRIIGMLLIYLVDVPLLLNCEGWINTIDAMVRENGWNRLMYSIAMEGHCSQERDGFFICTGMALICFVYVTSCTGRYLDSMGQMPRHLLRVPKDLPSGSYCAVSGGERGPAPRAGQLPTQV
mmetsp:Transcript_88298/g.230109  ORF Transcript_88298/g.230109 Transcript_88298/m.230109 type:complete len:224 (+) Transcript_88298:171-842(+)